MSGGEAPGAAPGPQSGRSGRIRRVITTRAGGVSEGGYAGFNLGEGIGDAAAAVQANRERLATAIGLPQRNLSWMRQVHGTAVHRVTGPQAGTPPEADALVTTVPGLALGVLVADCVAVLLGDAEAGVVGAAHAGRRGAAAGVLPAVLAAMCEAGARPARIGVLLGPAACGRCYEVPEQLRDQVEAELPGSASITRWQSPGLDLRLGLVRQLEELGIGGIAADPRCTIEDAGLFSYRRDSSTGRQAAVVWREQP